MVAVAAGGTIPSKSLRTLVDADVEGNGYVVVATDKGYVRFFSGGGLQKGPIWSLDGDIVSMVAGREYRDLTLVTYEKLVDGVRQSP